jgi:hypothetical protein
LRIDDAHIPLMLLGVVMTNHLIDPLHRYFMRKYNCNERGKRK